MTDIMATLYNTIDTNSCKHSSNTNGLWLHLKKTIALQTWFDWIFTNYTG